MKIEYCFQFPETKRVGKTSTIFKKMFEFARKSVSKSVKNVQTKILNNTK